MFKSSKLDVNNFSEYFVDISDVFTEEVDADGLKALLSAFLEISQFSSGEAFIVGHLGFAELKVTYSSNNGQWQNQVAVEPSHLATRSMHTLQTEFTITGQDSYLVMNYAFPLRVRGMALGVVSLSQMGSHPMKDSTVKVLQNLADVAATVIDRTHCINQTRSLVGQLQTALDTRIVLEQAKGVLAERMKVDLPIAFQFLRNTARKEQLPIHKVASQIVAAIPENVQSMNVAN